MSALLMFNRVHYMQCIHCEELHTPLPLQKYTKTENYVCMILFQQRILSAGCSSGGVLKNP
jgi:hypothetical protein